MEYLIKQYALEPGAWEIQYIEEYFGEFPRRKTADEIITRLRDRESLILMAEAPLPDDPTGALVPVSYKIVHEIRADESVPKLRDLVTPPRRLRELRRPPHSLFVDRRHAPRLARPGPLPRAHRRIGSVGDAAGFEEVVVKVKNRYYDMRAVLASLQFNVVKHEPHATDTERVEDLSEQAAAGRDRARPSQHPHRRLRRVGSP